VEDFDLRMLALDMAGEFVNEIPKDISDEDVTKLLKYIIEIRILQEQAKNGGTDVV
jgi:hypothetical protein